MNDHKITVWERIGILILLPFVVWQKFCDTYKIESFCAIAVIASVAWYASIGYGLWRVIT